MAQRNSGKTGVPQGLEEGVLQDQLVTLYCSQGSIDRPEGTTGSVEKCQEYGGVVRWERTKRGP